VAAKRGKYRLAMVLASYFFTIDSISVTEAHPAASQKGDRDRDYHH